jgi:hypothetical protein
MDFWMTHWAIEEMTGKIFKFPETNETQHTQGIHYKLF